MQELDLHKAFGSGRRDRVTAGGLMAPKLLVAAVHTFLNETTDDIVTTREQDEDEARWLMIATTSSLLIVGRAASQDLDWSWQHSKQETEAEADVTARCFPLSRLRAVGIQSPNLYRDLVADGGSLEWWAPTWELQVDGEPPIVLTARNSTEQDALSAFCLDLLARLN